MVEIHCWVTIRTHYSLEDDNLENTIKLINDKITSFLLNEVVIKAMNGEYYLEFSMFSNHMAQDAKNLLELFYYIGEVAIGSYGLLYLHNDEDAVKHNSFKVYRLCKGKVIEHDDKLLSPCIPMVEE